MHVEIAHLLPAWKRFREATDIAPIRDEGLVQEVLAGRRDLDIRQLRALGQRFGVSPGTFV